MANRKVSLFGLVQVGVIVVFASSTLALFDGVSIYFELLTHFRLQYLVISFAFICITLIARNLWYSVLSATVLLHSSIIVFPWYFTSSYQLGNDKSEIRILQSNVRTDNTNYQNFINFVNSASADIISVQEVNIDWVINLEVLREKYPFIVVSPREDNFGIAVLSKVPIEEQEIVEFGKSGVPSIRVSFYIQERKVTLISVHTLPPIGEEYFNARNAQLSDLGGIIRNIGNPVIVVGDLNISMWSSYYNSFVELAGLKNSRGGFGILPTWPTNIPFLKIPIDHILVSDDFVIKNVEVCEDIGSDHYPYVASVLIK